jgi:flagellar motor switch/type III secretory pathway protein FliN
MDFSNIKKTVRIRLAEKRMILNDVKKIDNGMVIKSNKTQNSPIELVLDDKVIALGEVVSVDGKYGIKISKIIEPIFSESDKQEYNEIKKYSFKDLEM